MRAVLLAMLIVANCAVGEQNVPTPTEVYWISVSPDERSVAVRTDAGTDVYSLEAGQVTHRIPSVSGSFLAWSPADFNVVLLGEVAASGYFFGIEGKRTWLKLLDVTSGKSSRIETPALSTRLLAWSPNGAEVAEWYAVGSQIIVFDVPTPGGPFSKTRTVEASSWLRPQLLWSPDSEILYIIQWIDAATARSFPAVARHGRCRFGYLGRGEQEIHILDTKGIHISAMCFLDRRRAVVLFHRGEGGCGIGEIGMVDVETMAVQEITGLEAPRISTYGISQLRPGGPVLLTVQEGLHKKDSRNVYIIGRESPVPRLIARMAPDETSCAYLGQSNSLIFVRDHEQVVLHNVDTDRERAIYNVREHEQNRDKRDKEDL